MTIEQQLLDAAEHLKTIRALAENPHWTAARRWEIGRQATDAAEAVAAALRAVRARDAAAVTP